MTEYQTVPSPLQQFSLATFDIELPDFARTVHVMDPRFVDGLRYFTGSQNEVIVVSATIPDHLKPIMAQSELHYLAHQQDDGSWNRLDMLLFEIQYVPPEHLDEYFSVRSTFLRDVTRYCETAIPELWPAGYSPASIHKIIQQLDL